MDPASFSFAVVGMFLTCCKGFTILSDACKASSDADDAACQVRMERAKLEAWGGHFDIWEGQQSQYGEERLRTYLMNSRIREAVSDALCAIAKTFVDIRRLDQKYGIVFDYQAKSDRSPRMPRDVQDLLDGRERSPSHSPSNAESVDERMKNEFQRHKVKMSLLERCRWSLRGKHNLHDLIETLRRHNGDLLSLCQWEDLKQMNRGLPSLTLPQSKNPVELNLVADLANEDAKDKASPMAEGSERVAEMARFKAKLMTPLKVSNKYQVRWRLLDQKDYVLNSTRSPYTLGECLRTQDPIFVEWQSYKGENGRPDKLAEIQIHELGNFLTVPRRPHEFRALDCIGMFKDGANDRYGVVYNLPERLRRLSHRTRTENRRIFNPSTLTLFMENVESVIDLGLRFELARKLVYSVVALHTCGWLHKNISPDNIFLFPGRPAPGEKIKDYRKDVGRPIIVGYGLSRPDDISIEQPEDRQRSRRAPVEVEEPGLDRPSRRYMEGDEKNAGFNIYQHPDKLANPNRRFRHSYDIYSLGLVLLELGLWQSLQSFDTSRWKDAYGFQRFVLDRLVPDLWGQCGAIYGGVVKECLTMKSDDLEVAEEGQRRLAWGIAQRLDRCVA